MRTLPSFATMLSALLRQGSPWLSFVVASRPTCAYRFRFKKTIWLITFVAVTSATSTSDAVQAI